MKDIVSIQDGLDLGVADSVVSKAANLIAVQLGTLEYAPTFGVDKKFFLESPLQFQNESFRAYLIQRLTENQINVASVTEVLSNLFETLTFQVGDATENVKGFIV